jgi:DNA-binding NarL/FixJ family response regulator
VSTPRMSVLSNSIAAACADADYQCGHITRSSSRAVKRAAFLYAAEVRDLGYLGTRTEAPEVLAALALMREGAACAEVLDAATGATPEVVEAVEALTYRPADLSPEVLAVMALVTEGLSYPEIAAEVGCAKETVRSHVKRAMRLTSTHNAVSAAVTLVEEGLI